MKEQHDRLVKEKKVTAELLKEFRFMKNVDTLEKFKAKIKTCEFWGETMAISTLERLLNIKMIILSEESYDAKDYDSVLRCGQLNDADLERQGVFAPDFYRPKKIRRVSGFGIFVKTEVFKHEYPDSGFQFLC